MSEAKYKRVLLKLSGEALAGEQKTGVNPEIIGKICDKIKEVVEMGVQVAIVVGGGVISFRVKNLIPIGIAVIVAGVMLFILKDRNKSICKSTITSRSIYESRILDF